MHHLVVVDELRDILLQLPGISLMIKVMLPMLTGFVSFVHEINGTFAEGCRFPIFIVTVAPSANLSVLSPLVNDDTTSNGLVLAERSIVAPSVIVAP